MSKKSLNVKIVTPKNKILIHLKDRKFKENLSKLQTKFETLFKKKINLQLEFQVELIVYLLAFFLKCLSLYRKIKVFYYHVDHSLRENSDKQAEQLFKILNKVGIKIEILKWTGSKPNSNILKIARVNRYGLNFQKNE